MVGDRKWPRWRPHFISRQKNHQPPESQDHLSSTPSRCLLAAIECPHNRDMAHHQPAWAFAGPETPATPRTPRTLRKFRSHQVLTTSSALIAQTQSAHSTRPHGAAAVPVPTPGSNTTRTSAHRRARSNSDAAARDAGLVAPAPTQRRPARKTGSGIGIKRSNLEILLRDGPQNGNYRMSLGELQYFVLMERVDADGDGMVRPQRGGFVVR